MIIERFSVFKAFTPKIWLKVRKLAARKQFICPKGLILADFIV